MPRISEEARYLPPSPYNESHVDRHKHVMPCTQPGLGAESKTYETLELANDAMVRLVHR
jgi:hypothetical protein